MPEIELKDGQKTVLVFYPVIAICGYVLILIVAVHNYVRYVAKIQDTMGKFFIKLFYWLVCIESLFLIGKCIYYALTPGQLIYEICDSLDDRTATALEITDNVIHGMVMFVIIATMYQLKLTLALISQNNNGDIDEELCQVDSKMKIISIIFFSIAVLYITAQILASNFSSNNSFSATFYLIQLIAILIFFCIVVRQLKKEVLNFTKSDIKSELKMLKAQQCTIIFAITIMILTPMVFVIINKADGDDRCLKQAFVAYEFSEPVSLVYKILPISFIMASHIKNYGANMGASLDEQISDIDSKSSDGRVRMGTHVTITDKAYSEMNQSDVQQPMLIQSNQNDFGATRTDQYLGLSLKQVEKSPNKMTMTARKIRDNREPLSNSSSNNQFMRNHVSAEFKDEKMSTQSSFPDATDLRMTQVARHIQHDLFGRSIAQSIVKTLKQSQREDE